MCMCIHTYIDREREGIFFSLKKEGDLSICNNMNESGGHYPKKNNPETKEQILKDPTYMRH